ncbi:MAG: excinuclease ABC subunit A [Myxococcota bacterium]|jgi:excinuclease ABC subunit A
MAGRYRAGLLVVGAMMKLTIRGAREHNLCDLDLDIPLGALVVFTGVSGSGKSSLAFDTLFAEGRRRYLEAASSDKARPASLTAPDVDVVEGLPPAVALEQRSQDPGFAETTASLAGAMGALRLVFGRAGTLHCPVCNDAIHPVTHDQIAARILALDEGSRVLLEAPVRRRGASTQSLLETIARAGFSRVRIAGEIQRLDSVAANQVAEDVEIRIVVDRFKVDPSREARVYDAIRTASRAGSGEVVVTGAAEMRFVDRPYCAVDDLILPRLEPRLLDRRAAFARCEVCAGTCAVDGEPCGTCGGLGLGEVARAVQFADESLGDVLGRTVSAALTTARMLPSDTISKRPLADWIRRLQRLVDLGLGEVALMRRGPELSSGEAQRLRLARQLGGELSGVLYVLDEPAAGVSAVPAEGVLRAIRDLVKRGNSVVAVAHNPVIVHGADHVVEFGPGAGAAGGRVLFEGDVTGLLASDTPTGRWLSGKETLPTRTSTAATKSFTVSTPYGPLALPMGRLTAIVGESGSGKTRRLSVFSHASHPDNGGPFERVVTVDRRSVGRSSRSTVATFTGTWSILRSLLSQTVEAKVRGIPAAMFSLNKSGGRCEACKGTGELVVDLQWLPDVYLRCDVCSGRRFTGDVLAIRWKGLAADELLALSAEEGRALLSGHPDLEARLRALVDVGLGYMTLGQPGHTWSGGEARRLLFANELTRANRRGASGTVFVLDDPTVGLHPQDTAHLHALLSRLVEQGATVWMATHDRSLAAACDVQIEV